MKSLTAYSLLSLLTASSLALAQPGPQPPGPAPENLGEIIAAGVANAAADPHRPTIDTEAIRRAMLAQFAPGPMEKGPFMGVAASPAPAALRDQLKLPAGVGLVVDHLEPESPAATAGVKQYDVLHKLDDQLLVDPHQLSVLVRIHKPGDEVALTLIRQGESQVVQVKLIERDLPPLGDGGPMPFIGGPPPMRGPFMPQKRSGGWSPSADVVDGSVIEFKDAESHLQVTTEDGKQSLLAKDSKGTVLFDGPIDTPEQRNEVPDQIRPKLDRMLGLTDDPAPKDPPAGGAVQPPPPGRT
jgi:hypothetical protein